MTLNFIFLGVHSMTLGNPTTPRPASLLVCHCKAVNDRTIRQAIRSGAQTCRQVDRACAAGGNCGGCVPLIQALIASEREDRHASSGDIGVAAS